ncbi:MAG: ABC transporter permease [Roseburia sp.]
MMTEQASKDKEKQQKVKKIKQKIESFLTFILMPVLLVIVWQWGSDKGFINPHILPSPSKEVTTFGDLIASGKLQRNLIVSAVRVIQGFVFGAAFGLIIGSIMGLSRKLHKLLISLVGIFRPIPMIAWIPLLILWMGIGEPSKVTVIAMGCFWPILLNTIQGFQSIDIKLLEVAKILEKNRWQVMRAVILPSALPSVFTGIRLGLSSAWTCVVAAEMIAASEGIGYMITYARELTQPHVMLVGVFSIGFIGLFIDTLVLKLQTHLLKWNNSAKQ